MGIKMSELKNSDVLKSVLLALYYVAGRRTSQNFAIMVIGTIIKMLEQKYNFLKHIRIYTEKIGSDNYLIKNAIDIAPDINSVHPARLGRAIEAIIQVVYMDLSEKAGLFFITEVKKHVGQKIIPELINFGVDLDLIQIEQHYLYRKQKRKKTPTCSDGDGAKENKEKELPDNATMLGYTWKHVSSWKFDSNSDICVIFDKEGKELDRLDVNRIIRSYIGRLTGDGDVELLSDSGGEEIDISKKEFELLKLLHMRDMLAEEALELLQISEEELNSMIRRLLTLEMLNYTSFNELELTSTAINHLSSKKEKNS